MGPDPSTALTPRQREVAALVAEGLTNAEVADSLGLTVKAVEKHVSAIFDRLGVDSRTAVAAVVLTDRGSVPPRPASPPTDPSSGEPDSGMFIQPR